jgi:hypothetical protein
VALAETARVAPVEVQPAPPGPDAIVTVLGRRATVLSHPIENDDLPGRRPAPASHD